MTKLRVREYEVDDFMTIELSDVEKATQIGQPVAEWGKYHKTHGISATVVDPKGQIVFCLGVHHRLGNSGEVWALYSPLAKQYPATLRMTKELIECIGRQFGYTRLQAAVDPQFPETIRFIEHLGFKREALMQRYGPHGEDFVLYAMLKED